LTEESHATTNPSYKIERQHPVFHLFLLWGTKKGSCPYSPDRISVEFSEEFLERRTIGESFLFKSPVRKTALIVKIKWPVGQNYLSILSRMEDLIESKGRGNKKLVMHDTDLQ